VDLLVALGSGLAAALSWPSIGFIVIGVVIGLVLGILPGLGGVTGLTLLLPLAFTLPIEAALAMMIALTAVTATGDTIPAILLGIPGSSAAAATVVDGYPMAKRGEAARALGAAYVSSCIGGLVGAFVLVLSIPVLRPIVLIFGPPEIFMLAMLGLVTVGMLGGNDPLRGWAAGGLGVTLAMIGRDPINGTARFAFGSHAMWEGLPLIAVALGLFALPELILLSRRGASISRVELPENLWEGQLQGIKDSLRNWFLVIRCSALGTWIGFLPGLGGHVADWIAYGHAQTSVKNPENFGKGDVRGVIAPESANNSVKGGELIPTLAFGVPGSATMAILFGALLIAGVSPGKQLLTDRLDLTMVMVWSLVISNLIGAAICLFFTRYLAKITALPGISIVAVTAPLIMLSTYSDDALIEPLLMLIALGVLGYFMRQTGWPRAPLLVGFVLGGIVEVNLANSVRLFGASFLLRPLTTVLFVLLIASFAYGIYSQWKRSKTSAGQLPNVRGM
jgi:putative tricarboxylic transport membrane protein